MTHYHTTGAARANTSNDLMIESRRGLRRERMRRDSAVIFAVCALVIFIFLVGQLVAQLVEALA